MKWITLKHFISFIYVSGWKTVSTAELADVYIPCPNMYSLISYSLYDHYALKGEKQYFKKWLKE